MAATCGLASLATVLCCPRLFAFMYGYQFRLPISITYNIWQVAAHLDDVGGSSKKKVGQMVLQIRNKRGVK